MKSNNGFWEFCGYIKDVLPSRTKLDTIITKQTYGADF
jgi:hypothetical protein